MGGIFVPADGGTTIGKSKSLLSLLYSSAEKVNLFLRKAKSKPKFCVIEVSHFTSALGIFLPVTPSDRIV